MIMQAIFVLFCNKKKCTEEGESSIYLGIKVYSSRFLPCILNSNENQNRNKHTSQSLESVTFTLDFPSSS